MGERAGAADRIPARWRDLTALRTRNESARGLLVIVLQFVGNIPLSVALWAAAHVLMYLSLVYAQTIGPTTTPPTVPVGAVVVVISGGGWPGASYGNLRR